MTQTVQRIGTVEDPLRLAVFISGSGSGMAALLRHQQNDCTHQTTLVLSNVPNVKGLRIAKDANVPTVVVEIESLEHFLDPTEGNRGLALQKRRESHEETILKILEERNIEAVILSGYMRILSPLFVREWNGRLLNIHPSLLPKYPGAHAHRDALADGATITGCTVHFVDEGMDSGPIIAQQEVAILPSDDEDSLSERVKKVEHILYPAAIDAFAAGEIKFE